MSNNTKTSSYLLKSILDKTKIIPINTITSLSGQGISKFLSLHTYILTKVPVA